MNKIILMGRLTKEPETETTVNNNLHTKFNLAVDRRFSREGYQQTDFIPISVWGKSAEFASMYFKKGMRVVVVGRLELNNYVDKQTGQNRTFTQVTAEELHFAESKKTSNDPFAGGYNMDSQNQIKPENVKDDVQFSDISEDSAFNIDEDPFETVDDVNFNE